MSLSWLASLVGVKAGTRGRVGIRRKAAPEAQRELAGEIAMHALPIRRLWVRDVLDGDRLRRTVIARVDARRRREVDAWLSTPADAGQQPSDGPLAPAPPTRIETSWVLLPHADQAVLATVVLDADSGGALLRCSLRFSAIADRRALDALAATGRLALLTGPLRWGGSSVLDTPHVYLPLDPAPLSTFLRDRPTAVV